MFQLQLADSFGWIGRVAEYSGCIFLIVALLQPTVEVGVHGNASERWDRAFTNDRRQFDALFTNIVDGLSYQKMVYAKDGKPVDYITLKINKAYKRITGLGEEIIGKTS